MSSHLAIEIEGLEHLNQRGWHYVSTYARRLNDEGEQLRHFVQSYVDIIGKWVPSTKRTSDDVCAATMRTTSVADNNSNNTPSTEPAAWLHQQQKRLYRQIAKRCHPDVVQDLSKRDYYAQLLQRVNEAYAEADSQTLQSVMLQLERERLEQHEYLDYLRHRHAEMCELLEQFRITLNQLRSSPEYKLKQKFHQAKSDGQPLLRHIVRQMMISS